MLAVTPQACVRKRTARLERAPPGWRPGALPLKQRPRKEPPAGVEPAPQPYEGCVLPLTPQRRDQLMETAGVEPAPPRCKRGDLTSEPRPQVELCGRVESNHLSAWPRVYRPQSSPMLSVRKRATDRIRTGTAGFTTPNAAVTSQSPRKRGRPDSNRRRLGRQPSALAVLSYAPNERK
jgi:hypothetical protein